MKFFKRAAYFIVLAGLIIFLPIHLMAQPPDPCTDPLDPCPIDSNLVVLIAVALAIAAKKAYDFKKTSPAV